VVTHLHIDHLGTLAEVVQRYRPKVLVYQGYSKYLRDPSKVNQGGKSVLGEVADIYGEVEPVNGEILEVGGGEVIDLGDRKMELLYTPGHAKHHISVLIDGILYAGDSAGGRYNGLPIPTTPPPLNLRDYVNSLRRQISLRPKAVGLAHGGLVNPSHMGEHLEQILKGKYRVDVNLGGEAEVILKKHLEVNYRGIEEALLKEKLDCDAST